MPDGGIQFEVFPTDLHLRRVDPAKSIRRFYKMVIQRDLFGGASLIREWGRLGSPGKLRVDHHLDEGHAVNALIKLMTTKRMRGYELL